MNDWNVWIETPESTTEEDAMTAPELGAQVLRRLSATLGRGAWKTVERHAGGGLAVLQVKRDSELAHIVLGFDRSENETRLALRVLPVSNTLARWVMMTCTPLMSVLVTAWVWRMPWALPIVFGVGLIGGMLLGLALSSIVYLLLAKVLRWTPAAVRRREVDLVAAIRREVEASLQPLGVKLADSPVLVDPFRRSPGGGATSDTRHWLTVFEEIPQD
jgi:hypothetical protein